MAQRDKYKLYGELAQELYALGYNFKQNAKILADAFPSAAGDAAPPGPATIAGWYRKDQRNWDAAKKVKTSYAVTVQKIYEDELRRCSSNEERAAENGVDLCSKWYKHFKEVEAQERQGRINFLKDLNREIDRPALFLEHLEFIFSVLPKNSAAYKALAEQFDVIVGKYKEHVETQAHNRA